jgi:hypothetical protein
MPLWDDEKDSIWMLPGYLDGIRQAGAVPFIFPFSAEDAEPAQLMGFCDGFLFTGGHDVSPRLYHEEPPDGLVFVCEKRDTMEAVVLRSALEADKPVLGICRGIQFINAALGGTLYLLQRFEKTISQTGGKRRFFLFLRADIRVRTGIFGVSKIGSSLERNRCVPEFGSPRPGSDRAEGGDGRKMIPGPPDLFKISFVIIIGMWYNVHSILGVRIVCRSARTRVAAAGEQPRGPAARNTDDPKMQLW